MEVPITKFYPHPRVDGSVEKYVGFTFNEMTQLAIWPEYDEYVTFDSYGLHYKENGEYSNID